MFYQLLLPIVFALMPAKQQSIYDFKMPGLTGGVVDFSAFKGKKILVVNTASECGFTYQYEGLEILYQKEIENMVIIGVPSNDFGKQEPGPNDSIASFCKKNFGVTFPMCAKQEVKGKHICKLYQFLTTKSENGFADSYVKWNFQKYLFDENGKMVGIFYSKTEPLSEELLMAIHKSY